MVDISLEFLYYLVKDCSMKHDLRRTEFRVIEDSIMYEVELPSSDVLLSDFDNWHSSTIWNESKPITKNFLFHPFKINMGHI